MHVWQNYRASRRARLLDRESKQILRGATPIVEDVHGFRFVLYPFDRANVISLVERPADVADFKVIPQLVGPGDIAFDVGANVGIYSALLSRLCGPAGRVWAFEPVPETHWRLRENLALNRCGNVTAVQGAVCDKDGTVQMNLFDSCFAEWNSLGKPSMVNPAGGRISPHKCVEVAACTLDRFCVDRNIERVNFLKVDVEGFELSVFKGASSLLKEHRVDYVCFEISQESLKGADVESRQVFGALENYGYVSYSLDRTTGKFSGPIRDTSEEWTNFYASTKDLANNREEVSR